MPKSIESQFPIGDLASHYELCVTIKKKAEAVKEKGEKARTQCTTCGKTFCSVQSLETHEKIHLRARGVSEEEAGTALYHYCDRRAFHLPQPPTENGCRLWTKGQWPGFLTVMTMVILFL